MKIYKHTQRGTVIIVALLGGAVAMTIAGVVAATQMFVLVPAFLLIGWLFNSLTIEITEDELRWRFGPGLIRDRVKLADITSARAVRTNYFEGWGIHWTRFGWLYNVSGCDAVEVRLHRGRGFALGTDEAELLARLLKSVSPKNHLEREMK